MADNTVAPEESTSASGAVLAQAGIDSSDSKVEEQVAAPKEPKTEATNSNSVVDNIKQDAPADTTTDNASSDNTKKEEDSNTKDTDSTMKDANASPTDRKRKYSNDDSSNFRERRDRFQKGNEYRNHDRNDNRVGNRRYQNNSKSHYEDLPETDDPEAIRKQVEFYFSDSNLLQDAYLLKAVDGPRNNAVSVKMIHSFKRMRHFQPYSAVVAALKDSSTLTITGSDGNEEIVRKTPLPEEVSTNAKSNRTFYEDKTIPRSIYAKGFPEESATTQTDIEAFFSPYGPINAVRLRRNDDREFKRSVFVEFGSEETQKAFLDLDPKPKFGSGENEKELQIQSKLEYVEGKKKLIDEGVIRASSPDGRRGGGRDYDRGGRGGRGGGRGRGRGGGGRGRGGGGRDRNRSRERRDRDDRSRSPRRSDRRRDDRDGGGETLSEDKPARYVCLKRTSIYLRKHSQLPLLTQRQIAVSTPPLRKEHPQQQHKLRL